MKSWLASRLKIAMVYILYYLVVCLSIIGLPLGIKDDGIHALC